MSEIIDRTIEYMPYIGAVAGAMAGIAAETVAVHKHSQDQEALTAVLGDIGNEQAKERLSSRMRRIGGATILVAGASVGLLNGIAWQPVANDEMPPTLGVVVDHSGAVGSNEEVLSGVDSMAVVFDSNNFEATAYVAANGEVVPMEPSKVPQTEPFGDAPLEQAMTTAFGQNLKAREKNGLTGTKTGVFAIVNGNRFGGVDSVIATAKAQETPLFIANVEGEADTVVVDEFKRIAKETGGVYFDVQSDNTKEMSNKIQDTLDKNQLKRDQPNRWPLKVMAGLLGVGTFAAGIRNRSKEPTNKRIEV